MAKSDSGTAAPIGAMTPEQIRQMMENARKEIAARKKQLGDVNQTKEQQQVGPQVGPTKPVQVPPAVEDKAQALAALQVGQIFS